MVAGRDRLDDAGDARRVEASEQYRRFHLRRSDGQAIVERHGGAGAAHGKRQPAAGASGEAGTHLRQWVGDARHGPLAERGVADESCGQVMAGEQAHQQAGRGAAIAHVERALRLKQSANADAMDMPDAIGVALNVRAHRPHGGGGRQHVFAFQQAFDPAFAHGQCRQHERAVRNALVPRYGHAARQGGCGGECHRAGQFGGSGHGSSSLVWREKMRPAFDSALGLWQGARRFVGNSRCAA